MIGVPPGVRVLVATKPVDFRCGAERLAAIAKSALKQDVYSGAVLVFRARRADRVKRDCQEFRVQVGPSEGLSGISW